MQSNNTHTKKLVTIYLPTHNRVEKLKEAVNSIFKQTYKNWELIIVDDCSTDSTRDYLSNLSDKYEQISVYRNESPKGACYSRNIALNNAKGFYITGLDDDDYMLENHIETLWKSYLPSYSFVCNGWKEAPETIKAKIRNLIVYSYGKINLKKSLNKNHIGNQIFTETYKLQAVGGFDELLPCWQDYDLWIRLIKEFGDAYKNKLFTQIVCVDNTSRISNSPKRIKGIKIFLDKHSHLMSKKQKSRVLKIISELR